MTDILLGLSQICVSYGENKIICDLNLSLKYGERIAIIGSSGSGKSTLLKSIVGIEAMSSGNVCLNGRLIIRDGLFECDPFEIRRQVGLVFQSYCLFPNFTVKWNLVLGMLRVLGVKKNVAEDIASEVLSFFGLSNLADRYPETLSGGQMQRVALCRALVLKPQVLLLDEVTSALDPQTTYNLIVGLRKAWDLFTHESASRNGMLIVTHNLRFAEEFCDKIVFLDKGVIVDEHPAELFCKKASSDEAKLYLKYAWR